MADPGVLGGVPADSQSSTQSTLPGSAVGASSASGSTTAGNDDETIPMSQLVLQQITSSTVVGNGTHGSMMPSQAVSSPHGNEVTFDLDRSEKAVKYTFSLDDSAWHETASIVVLEDDAFSSGTMRVAFRLQDLTQGAGAAREYVAKCSKADLSSSGRSPSISASAVPGGRRGVPLPLSVTRIAESEASSATAEPEADDTAVDDATQVLADPVDAVAPSGDDNGDDIDATELLENDGSHVDARDAANGTGGSNVATEGVEMYFRDVHMQAVAQAWADRFSAACPSALVTFVEAAVLRLVDRPGAPYVAIEPYLTGSYCKWNNNAGFVQSVASPANDIAQALSHFTYEASGHTLMAVDLQGVAVPSGRADGRFDLTLTDPQFHSVGGRGLLYGMGDLGRPGMDLFLNSHICNTFCAQLDLSPDETLGGMMGASLSGAERDGRAFINGFPDFAEVDPRERTQMMNGARAKVGVHIRMLEEEILAHYPPEARAAPASKESKTKDDFSVYIGAGGNALTHWILHRHYAHLGEDERAEASLAAAVLSVETALEIVQVDIDEDYSAGISFYTGAAGPYAIGSVLYHIAGRGAERDALVASLLALEKEAMECDEDELLYGRAGYLYALLFVRTHVPLALLPPQMSPLIDRVAVGIIQRGIAFAGGSKFKDSGAPMVFLWPSRHRMFHYGAAHGIAGIIYVLLHVPRVVLSTPVFRRAVEGSVRFLMDHQFESGNFPIRFGSSRDELVHFCHGATGMIAMLCKAHSLFGDPAMLEAATRAVDCIWERGLLKKGTGVCHGVSGSMLGILSLYRFTNEERLLYRAFRMCEFTWNERCLDGCSRQPDRGRWVTGKPDHEFSLMEGIAGLVCAYVALLQPEVSFFPGYDGMLKDA